MPGSTDTSPPASPAAVVDASVTLFGHPPNPAHLALLPRNRGWRVRRALLPLSVGVVLAPIVALLPPHAPWVVAVLGTTGTIAWRRWKEEFTIVEFEARCPRCDADLHVPSGTRLRSPHTLTCEACGHDPILKVKGDPARTSGERAAEMEERPAAGEPPSGAGESSDPGER